MKNIVKSTIIATALVFASMSATAPVNAKQETPTTSTAIKAPSKLWQTSNGSVGRLSIGSYSAQLYPGSSQSIVDAPDSAAYISWENIVMIADHAAQGFSIIRSLGPGASATITDDATITYLTCASTYQGTNTGNGIDLVDGRYAEQVGDGQYILYTCNDATGVSVTVTYWNVTGSAPVYVPTPEPVVETPAPTPVATPEPTPVATPASTPAPKQETAPVKKQETTVQVEQESAPVETEVAEEVSQETEEEVVVEDVTEESVTSQEAEPSSDTEVVKDSVFNDSDTVVLLTANKWDANVDCLTARNGFTPDDKQKQYYVDDRRWFVYADLRHELEF